MDKQAFKQRMQNLKSYRENNPGKGYWDWKVQAYQNGGRHALGVGHMVGDNTPAILNASPNVRISNPDSSYEDYVNQANKKHAQTWDFRGNNSNLKDDQGNYYIDPMRSKGAKIPEQWESLEDADISELTNTFAYNMYQDPVQYMANGGEVGDPDDEFTKAINIKLGRTPDGRPKEQGLKPVFDLEDAANLTPVGYVLSAKKVYDAVKQNDWLRAGLAGLGFIPFIPKGVRRIAKQIPTVISLSEDNITKPEDFPTGLIRHEIGHYVDEMAYPGGVPNNAYLRQLGKPSKYRPFEEVKGYIQKSR